MKKTVKPLRFAPGVIDGPYTRPLGRQACALLLAGSTAAAMVGLARLMGWL